MTVFVLEGPDLAGKSTLAESLKEALGTNLDRAGRVQIVHTGPPTPDYGNLFGDYMSAAHAAHLDENYDHVIFDRLHIGEIIYGPRYRDGSRLSATQVRAIEEYLDSIGAVKIFVDAPDAELERRFHERGDDMVEKLEDLKSIASEYRVKLGTTAIHPVVQSFADIFSIKFEPFRGWIHWTPVHSVVAGYRG